ncbi:MAG: septum site-determining protein MinC [Myxococcota bacterium]|nr:septum site-determining protein MinC [Myxococcota bacterium]
MTTEPARKPELSSVQDHAARIEHQDDVHVLVLTSEATFDEVRDQVRILLAPDGPHAALRGETVRLDLGDRDVVLLELRRLTSLLAEEADVHIGGLVCSPRALHRYAEQELKMRVHVDDGAAAPPGLDDGKGATSEATETEAETDSQAADDGTSTSAPSTAASDALHSAADAAAVPEGVEDTSDLLPAGAGTLAVVHADPARPVPAAAIPEGGRRTVSVHRSLRSGAQVRFPGDLVVFGDVNPGAEVVADGSIVVLGALRGMAHPGAHGDESATVMAFHLTPTNLRIARRQATDLPTEDTDRPGLLSLLRAPGLADRGAPRVATARVARVVDGAVVVEDYAARASR